MCYPVKLIYNLIMKDNTQSDKFHTEGDWTGVMRVCAPPSSSQPIIES
jgi:hypothetical protein